jgi:hypothetical protein
VTGSRLMGRPAAIGRRLRGLDGAVRWLSFPPGVHAVWIPHCITNELFHCVRSSTHRVICIVLDTKFLRCRVAAPPVEQMMQRVRANCANPAFSGPEMLDFDPEILDFDPGTAAGDMSPKYLASKIRGAAGGYTAGQRLKAAAAGDYAGHLAQSHAAVAAGTANAEQRQHVGKSDGGKRSSGKGVAKTGKRAKGVPRGPRGPNTSTFVCSYRRKNNKLSAKAICFDPNCKSARSCQAAKAFIARRDSRERAAKRARNEREMNSFD